jgi:Raf kinase inhibitor-like YbhB/YbcL family protein
MVAQTNPQPNQGHVLRLSTPSFQPGTPIPPQYSCKGADISPALQWSNAPAQTAAFALVMDDPDAPAGTWVHWTMWNIPPGTHEVPENLSKEQQLPDGTRQGRNDFHKTGYNGPCPPAGKAHRYYLRLYALDTRLDLPAGASRADLDAAMKSHILQQAEYMGTFRR